MLTDELRRGLIEAARQARGMAYVPYSSYPVGAAVLTSDGMIYTGVNIENAAYPDTICAERVAIFKAVSEGHREFAAMAVVTSNGGFPCGSCRQVLAEFSLNAEVLIADEQGRLVYAGSGDQLLPGAFLPQDLPRNNLPPCP